MTEVYDAGWECIILLMLVAGVLGGLTNYFRGQEEEKCKSLAKNMSMGVAASLLTPLFLHTISSGLLEESATNNIKRLVFFGFCLVASLSSKAFIQSVSDRILRDIRETREAVNDIEKKVEPMVSKATEPDGERNLGFQMRAFGFDGNERKILECLGNTNYSWRTAGGIARESGLSTAEVLRVLNWLLSNQLVVRIDDRNRTLWGVTLEGRDIVAGMTSQNPRQAD